MANNENLHAANKAKKDEFYTQGGGKGWGTLAGRRKRMVHLRGETEEDHSSGEAENDDALMRGGGRGGGR